jgi:hypothetical protein
MLIAARGDIFDRVMEYVEGAQQHAPHLERISLGLKKESVSEALEMAEQRLGLSCDRAGARLHLYEQN